MKVCNRCNTEKPLTDFVKRNNRGNGTQAYCKVCHNSNMRSQNRTDYMRNYDLQKTYGIDVTEYQRLLLLQDGKCAICDKTAEEKMKGKKKYLCVDHCHTTGNIRGLLCDPCNRAIGLLQDSKESLAKAINYLSKSRTIKAA